MLIARICTIPERRESFRRVAERILERQRRRIDRLDVVLNGFSEVPADFPASEHVRYRCVPGNGGPAERYRNCDGIAADDVVATLDDDLSYPPDYLERGLAALSAAEGSVTFGGVFWDAAVPRENLDYHRHRRLIPYPGQLRRAIEVPVLMGGASFHRGDVFGRLFSAQDEGFATNDDLMASLALQKIGVSIRSIPKAEGWIGELPAQNAEHALWRRDRDLRRKTFDRLVRENGFLPFRAEDVATRGRPSRVFVVEGHRATRAGVGEVGKGRPDMAVHTVEVVRGSLADASAREPGNDLEHLVPVPTEYGRFGWLPGVRAWRRRSCDLEARREVGRFLDWIADSWPIVAVRGESPQAQSWCEHWLRVSRRNSTETVEGAER